ncbi:hypothetical protein DEO72_LG6g1835 [Vigna unguiculata]|uniref:Uncharacterized protein n=1 Tax=Vigna unguiculata TaxID=3917 RepID=A0A4D6M7B6_VIGUN|nr:hypothetical protein DEO72_LG6g1835 [Vigna unguiculata]
MHMDVVLDMREDPTEEVPESSSSAKHFKDGFFKIVVKQSGCSLFYNEDGSTKFPFNWTNNPQRYKGTRKEELSMNDKWIAKGWTFRVVESTVRYDIEISLDEVVLSSLDNMELNALVRAMVEFNSKTLILGRRVGSMLQKEVKEGGKAKVEQVSEEMKALQAKYEKEKAVWDKEREELVAEKKRLGSWKVKCMDSEKKIKEKIKDTEVDNDDLNEKYQGLEVEL